MTEAPGADPHEHILREYARAALIRWQLALGCNGRPTFGSLRRNPLQGIIAFLTIELLSETTTYQTETLLADVERNLRHLIRRPRQSPWIGASTICALADGAVLVRDTSLLRLARARLQEFLKRQNVEGWFPERGGPDVGRLFLTLDALARVYRQNSWEELADPLRRVLAFLVDLVHPDGTIGGYYSSCGTAFISPYGVELLAPEFPDAAALAVTARRRYQRLADERFLGWHDDLCAVLGPSLTLAATNASSKLPLPTSFPFETITREHYPNAGILIFNNDAYHAVVGGRNGGSLHVTWRSGAPSLDEPGITVVCPRATRTSGRWDSRTRVEVALPVLSIHGILRRQGLPGRQRFAWIKRLAHWIASTGWIARFGKVVGKGTSRSHQLVSDRYRRDIILDDDRIRIKDAVNCRLACRTILCQSPPDVTSQRYVDRSADNIAPPAPIYSDGGRKVELIRTYRDGRLIDQRD
ncbi:MAG: hypothetical protein JSU63_06055 [Phycisphaerales bacterium]|nr:MAG: hypothetical protein JSU63_06055 [Phycisphaerales bacterium]